MNSLLKLRQNGIFDVLLFLFLDMFSDGGYLIDKIGNEFIYILFLCFIIFYEGKFSKFLEMTCFVGLNIIIFFDRSFFNL